MVIYLGEDESGDVFYVFFVDYFILGWYGGVVVSYDGGFDGFWFVVLVLVGVGQVGEVVGVFGVGVVVD